MNKTYKKLLLFLFFIFALLLIFTTETNASNAINSITMDVYIDNNGTAKITEVWDANLTEGTEGYKPYGNLGKCEISNFSVTDENGNTYTTISNWNADASYIKKAYKCGIRKVNNDVELCWGISGYGARKYTLKYEISNFVNQYKDSQGVYFGLIPSNLNPNSVVITIHGDKQFNEKNSKIWAFGYKGYIEFSNGNIVMDSEGVLESESYMVALIKFEDKTFNTNNVIDRTFDEIYNSATNNSVKTQQQEDWKINALKLGRSFYCCINIRLYKENILWHC